MVAAILLPILAEIGAPILKRLLADRADKVVDKIAAKVGVKPTAADIEKAYKTVPEAVASAVKEVEAEFSAEIDLDALFAREDQKSFFAWGWRPAMSWLLIWLWVWNTTLMPLLNSALKATLPPVPYEHLIAFCGVWLVIYGGGHTLKSVFGK